MKAGVFLLLGLGCLASLGPLWTAATSAQMATQLMGAAGLGIGLWFLAQSLMATSSEWFLQGLGYSGLGAMLLFGAGAGGGPPPFGAIARGATGDSAGVLVVCLLGLAIYLWPGICADTD